jgi:hypothetical protein
MDIDIEQIAEFYNEQLVNHMNSRTLEGKRASTTLDQSLFAHVQSFFMHLGAARDYLAAFCAVRLGKDVTKIDSLARLVEKIGWEDVETDKILSLMNDRGYIRKRPMSATKLEIAGWMSEVTDLRNALIHRRPYGDRPSERMGSVRALDISRGIYRYFRPIVIGDNDLDVLDVVLHHYREMTSFCHYAALASDLDTSMLTLSSKDIKSFTIHNTVRLKS